MSTVDLALLAFSDVLPILLRVAVLFQTGIVLWYILIKTCFERYHMNCLALLDLSYSPHNYSDDSQISQVTGNMAAVSPPAMEENQALLRGVSQVVARTVPATVASVLAYWATFILLPDSFVQHMTTRVGPLLLISFLSYVCFSGGHTAGQNRANTTLKRILVGNINSATMRTNDILLSDSLTSYSRVFNDLSCFIWVTFMNSDSNYNLKLEALALSYPALVRVRQSWYEYRTTRQTQHFLNLCKYLALLGPVVVNMLIKITMASMDSESDGTRLNTLNKWWYATSLISSTYSFIWDIKMDWGFRMFDIQGYRNHRRLVLLRDESKLVFRNNFFYFGVILIDFSLRFIWVLKAFVMKENEITLTVANRVGNFLFGYDFTSFGFSVLELLEILRRWLWCFLKLESDLVKIQLRDEFARGTLLQSLKTV